jgi:hypothetical protein
LAGAARGVPLLHDFRLNVPEMAGATGRKETLAMNILDILGTGRLAMPAADNALPGRSQELPTAAEHFVNHHPLKSAIPPALRPIRPTARSAAAARATTRWCWWRTTRRP